MKVYELRKLLEGETVDDNMEVILSFCENKEGTEDISMGGIKEAVVDPHIGLRGAFHIRCNIDMFDSDNEESNS